MGAFKTSMFPFQISVPMEALEFFGNSVDFSQYDSFLCIACTT